MTMTALFTRLVRVTPRTAAGAALALAAVAWPRPAEAQLDPLLFLKRSVPSITTPQYRANVLIAVDTAPRMQYDADGHYYDPTDYARGNMWDSSLGATSGTRYRRVYQNLQWSNSGSEKFTATTIATVTDASATAYAKFYQKTRIAVAKTALAQVITENNSSARFGLLKMRQSNPRVVSPADGPVLSSDAGQQLPTDNGGIGLWNIYRGVTDGSNRNIETSTSPLVRPDGTSPNAAIQTILAQPLSSSSLLPAGNDSYGVDDAALAHLLDDLKTEAARLATADTLCRNTVAILVTGGGEGTGGHTPSAASIAAGFLNVGSSRRVPIYVIAIAPPATAVAELQAIAAASGGKFYEITKAQVDLAAANFTAVPEVVRAMNDAVQHAFAQTTDFNTAPTVANPYGPESEFLVTSPIIGTVDLKGATTLGGTTLPDSETDIENPTSGADIPQRGNVMVTTGFAMPGFEARLRAFRVYKPVADSTKPAGYKFTQDGTALWVAKTPTSGYCNDATASCRNIYTILPGTTTPIAFNASNVGTLTPYLNTFDPEGLINFIRRQPLGAIVSSTPAFMDPPSLDPPPDSEYPGFVDANKDRRSLIFVGANDGMLHAIDGRTGIEVWAFIPFNLLPKLKTLRDGQGIDGFDYFMDSSVKVADVKIGSPQEWKTAIIVGQGAGGTFYQAFDATLEGMPKYTSSEVTSLLSYFSATDRIKFLWAFPDYSEFDYTYGPYGDLRSTASNEAKSVGQTWSDPAVGQIESPSSPYTVIVGSGFMPYSKEQQANRGGVRAGRDLYLLNADDGKLFANMTVGSDGVAENIDNCVNEALGCTQFKNALQADPVATGPSDSRFISKVYMGDLDGKVWRFDVKLDATGEYPEFNGSPLHLNASATAADQPIFASMATVAVTTQQYIFFGTGSDLLPVTGQSTIFKLVGVLDTGGSGTVTFQHTLAKVDGIGDDEVVSSFPAVAGDIVFFTTTTLKPQNPCTMPDANLYALTFVGSAAYDATGDNKVTNNETPKLKTLVGAGRATAPFIVDQHLAFGAGTKIEIFGDQNDYNNGVGHVGVRILSWRDLR